MTDLASVRKMIQLEESQFRFGVSESFAQKIGKSINFINERQHSEKQFFANGRFARVADPKLGVDGLVFVQFDIEIIKVYAFQMVAGSSGTTELDIKYATASGGSFASIFSTTPKFQNGSVDNSWIADGGTLANAVAPVLSSTDIDAGSALRFDIITSQGGNPENCGIVLHYRPR